MGPFEILSELHRELEDRLAALESGEEPGESETWRERFEELVAALRVHARLEERHLHPLLARVGGRVQAREGAEDQLTIRELLEELDELEPGDDEWWARFTALEDLVVAHVREAEAETFPRLISALDTHEQDELHQALLTLREELGSKTDTVSGSERLLEAPRGIA
jgi:sulfite reductase beta subunit-like hemoprotein